VDDHFRANQKRERDQQPAMRFNVVQERDLDAARQASAKGREQEQRQPREQRDDYNPQCHTV
jgi:hypothetical protein